MILAEIHCNPYGENPMEKPRGKPAGGNLLGETHAGGICWPTNSRVQVDVLDIFPDLWTFQNVILNRFDTLW